MALRLRAPRANVLISLLLLGLQLAPLLLQVDNPFVARLESLLYDLKIRAGMATEPAPQVAIVEIDDASLAAEGHWPWPRRRVARLVERLFEDYRIQVLGIDAVFAESYSHPSLALLDRLAAGELAGDPTFQRTLARLRPELEEDRLLADVLRRHPVALGFYFTQSAHRHTAGLLPEPAGFPFSGPTRRLPFPTATGYVSNIPLLQEGAAGGGYFDNPLIDDDGVLRRASLVRRYGDAWYTAFSLSVVRLLLGNPPLEPLLESDSHYALSGLDVGGLRVPTDERGGSLVPYRGRFRSFPYVSAGEVLAGTADPALLASRIVLLGFTAPGLMDTVATPVQESFPGVEVHANLVAGMLDGAIRQRPGYALAVELLQMLASGLLLTALLPRLTPLAGVAAALATLAALAGVNLLAWHDGLALPLAGPLILVLTLFLFHTAWGYFTETRRKQHLTRLFGQFVPKEVVEEMTRSRGEIRLDGESREMSVLFTDVRGFTTLSETISPQQVTRLVNLMLTWQTEIIYRYKGTIEKYTGDGLLAFWGAPLVDPEHARNALLASMEMLERRADLGDILEREGLPPIRFGLGLNTGTINVGNMGSTYRMAYAIQGDAVNLGSRIEGLTKFYGTPILAGEALQRRVPEYAYRFIDRVLVKGRREPVALFQPLCPAVDLAPGLRQELANYQAALDSYRDQDWPTALACFDDLVRTHPEVRAYAIFLERTREYLDSPPAEGFDGVYVHTSK